MFLIVGLDGATLDLVEPWVDEGVLPNLAALMRDGAWGRLTVPMPPVTFPSWTSFTTGVNPGRHGIFDFTRRESGSYRVRFVNSTFRKAPTIWSLLSQAGMRVCSLGIPGSYPPEPVNGYMLSGFDTPVTTRADASFAYPPSLADDVERMGGFPFADFQEFSVGPGWHRRALDSMLAAIDKKTELALSLLRRECFDCFMLLYGESDTVAHHFWALHDPDSPRFDAVLRDEVGDGVKRVYRKLDAALGRLLDEASPENVLVVSDHGFGGVGDVALYLNRWLAHQGFLTWRRRSKASFWAAGLRAVALRAIPERMQAPLVRLGGGAIAGAVESGVRFGSIDWSRTRAFSEELNYNPSIWLNVAAREPQGTVDEADYDHVISELSRRLMEWRDPFRNAPVVRRVWRRDEIFSGDYVHYAPDLTLDLETHDGYSYVGLSSQGRDGPVLEKLSREALGGGKLSGMSGSHRRQGVWLLSGQGVAPGRIRGVRMIDLAPTVMNLLGFAKDQQGFDGRVLPCVAPVDSERAEGPAPLKSADESYYDDVEEERLRGRLEQLGYLSE